MSVSLCWNVPPRISWWRRPDHEDRPGPIRRTQVDAQSGGWQHHLERAGQDRQGNRHPIGPTLQNALGAAPEHDAVTILVNSRGQPWTCNGFSTFWHRFKKALEAEGLVRSGRPSRGCAIPPPRPFAKLVWVNGRLRTCWGRTPPRWPSIIPGRPTSQIATGSRWMLSKKRTNADHRLSNLLRKVSNRQRPANEYREKSEG